MEQSETSVEIASSRSALEQTICPVFQEADRLRKESIAFWQTPSLTVQSLARKIMSEKPPISTKYIAGYTNMRDEIAELKKEDVRGKKEYLYDISTFINGVQLFHFIEKDSFEDNWSPIFYTSHILFPSMEKGFSFQKNSMNELIRYGKEFINQSLRLS